MISVPHGGYIKAEGLPPGTKERPTGILDPWGHDDYTLELGEQISDTFFKTTGMRPHMIYSNVSRSYFDPNRAKFEATGFCIPTSIAMYDRYHHCIQKASTFIKNTCGRGLYFDVHGQSHAQKWIEVGVGVGAAEMALPPENFDKLYLLSNARAAATRAMERGVNYTEFVKGKKAFGSLIAKNSGINAIPSDRQPKDAENGFFYGGTGPASTTARYYGSYMLGTIDSMQLENPWAVRKDAAARASFATAMVDSVMEYMSVFHDYDMKDGKCKGNAAEWGQPRIVPFSKKDLQYELDYGSSMAC